MALPANWRIHDIFHASLLNLYHETKAHGPNFTRPPPDLVEGEEEYEVERIIAHRTFGRSKTPQYLIKWKGYPESDNSWEPADQVHAPDLLKRYHSAAKDQSAVRSAATDQSAPQITPYQSTKEEQSAAKMSRIKGRQSTLEKHIECLTIFPASLSNSVPNTSSNTAGTASSTTAPFTTAIETCPPVPTMPATNPLTTAHPLPESLVLVATSPFQSCIYSASPSPSLSIKTTPPLVYPDSSVQATPPILAPPTCQSSLTSHWGDCLPSQYGTPSRPLTWAHPRSAPLSMPSSKL